MTRNLLVAAAVVVSVGLAAQTKTQVPLFELDANWPTLPNNRVLGQTPGVAVDKHDHIWVLHRPRTVPEAQRARAAPPLLEFGADGKVLRGSGGPPEGMGTDNSGNVFAGLTGGCDASPSGGCLQKWVRR